MLSRGVEGYVESLPPMLEPELLSESRDIGLVYRFGHGALVACVTWKYDRAERMSPKGRFGFVFVKIFGRLGNYRGAV